MGSPTCQLIFWIWPPRWPPVNHLDSSTSGTLYGCSSVICRNRSSLALLCSGPCHTHRHAQKRPRQPSNARRPHTEYDSMEAEPREAMTDVGSGQITT